MITEDTTRQIVKVRTTALGMHPSHITDFMWYNQNGQLKTGDRAEMVSFVGRKPLGAAYTLVNGITADLHVVQHWVETLPDSYLRDNLLSLERF